MKNIYFAFFAFALISKSTPSFAQGASVLLGAAAERKLESADGGSKRSLSEFTGKTLILFVSGRNSADAANAQQRFLGSSAAAREGVVRVSVADLKGIPFFVKGAAKRAIRKDHRAANGLIEADLKARKESLQAFNRFLTLMDFSGDVARQLGIGGKSVSNYHVFVFNPSGKLLLRLKQSEGGRSEATTRAQIIAAVPEAPRK